MDVMDFFMDAIDGMDEMDYGRYGQRFSISSIVHTQTAKLSKSQTARLRRRFRIHPIHLAGIESPVAVVGDGPVRGELAEKAAAVAQMTGSHVLPDFQQDRILVAVEADFYYLLRVSRTLAFYPELLSAADISPL